MDICIYMYREVVHRRTRFGYLDVQSGRCRASKHLINPSGTQSEIVATLLLQLCVSVPSPSIPLSTIRHLSNRLSS